MKKRYYLALFMVFFGSMIPPSKAITMPVPLSTYGSDTFFLSKKNTYKPPFLIKNKNNSKANKLGKIAKILGFIFLGLLVLTPIAPIAARLALAIIALSTGLLSLILALIGLGSAKDEETRNKSLKSLWIVLGIVVGVILIGLIIALIALLTSGFA